MIQLAGGLGHVYSGYKLALTIARWVLTRKQSTLGDQAASGIGVVTDVDSFWITQPLTKIALRIGPSTWTWNNIVLTPTGPAGFAAGSKVEIRVLGDPEVTPTRFDHR